VIIQTNRYRLGYVVEYGASLVNKDKILVLWNESVTKTEWVGLR
jgi:hypothetical protein